MATKPARQETWPGWGQVHEYGSKLPAPWNTGTLTREPPSDLLRASLKNQASFSSKAAPNFSSCLNCQITDFSFRGMNWTKGHVQFPCISPNQWVCTRFHRPRIHPPFPSHCIICISQAQFTAQRSPLATGAAQNKTGLAECNYFQQKSWFCILTVIWYIIVLDAKLWNCKIKRKHFF